MCNDNVGDTKHIRKRMAVSFHLVYLYPFCRLLSLLGNAPNLYYWIAKAGSKSGKQGNYDSSTCKASRLIFDTRFLLLIKFHKVKC